MPLSLIFSRMKLSFHPEVKTDLRGQYEYYYEIDPRLGLSFIEEYKKALAFVKAEPLVMRIFYGNDRRMPLKGFKTFALIYEVHKEEIWIKAVADLRRKPYFWLER
jgi:hypothetical protein